MEGPVTIRTYRGKTPAEALAAVKKDLGRAAVILNTRTYRTGGLLGFRARTVTEIIASDQSPVPPGGAGFQPARVPPTAAVPPSTAPSGRCSATGTPSSPETSLKEVARQILAANVRTPVEEELAAIARMADGGLAPICLLVSALLVARLAHRVEADDRHVGRQLTGHPRAPLGDGRINEIWCSRHLTSLLAAPLAAATFARR